MRNLKEKLIGWLKHFCEKKQLVSTSINEADIKPYDYFTQARSWSDDFYVQVEASKNRWKAAALWVLMPITFLLLLCLLALIPSQHLVPLMINHYQNGMVTVTPFKEPYAPSNQAQVESDIARYVHFYESYSADTYDYSYRLIDLMSSQKVAKVYARSQNVANKNSPINLLGSKGYQKVKINSIVFLDNASKNQSNTNNSLHRNLAQVDFVVTRYSYKTGRLASMPLTALIAWSYKGIPVNPLNRWMNWNGFTVTTYQVQQRSV